MTSLKLFGHKMDQNLLILIVVSVIVLIGLAGAFYGQGLIGAQLLGAGPGSNAGAKKDCSAEIQANADATAALADATAGYNNANARIQNALASAVTWRVNINNDNNAIRVATKAVTDADTAYKNAVTRGTAKDAAIAYGKLSGAEKSLGEAQAKLALDQKTLQLAETNLKTVKAQDGPKVAVAKQLLDDATAKSVAAAKALKACQQSSGQKP